MAGEEFEIKIKRLQANMKYLMSSKLVEESKRNIQRLKDNQGLPEQFVKDTQEALKEMKNGDVTPYKRRTLEEG